MKDIAMELSSKNPYDYLSLKQKYAALNLMSIFGAGATSGTAQEIKKVNHIISSEALMMDVSVASFKASHSQFSGMWDMVNALKGSNRQALERLFFAFYCIVAVGESVEAANILINVYCKLGFTELECFSILEKMTGKK